MLKKIFFLFIIINSGILKAQNDSLNKVKVEIKAVQIHVVAKQLTMVKGIGDDMILRLITFLMIWDFDDCFEHA